MMEQIHMDVIKAKVSGMLPGANVSVSYSEARSAPVVAASDLFIDGGGWGHHVTLTKLVYSIGEAEVYGRLLAEHLAKSREEERQHQKLAPCTVQDSM